MRTKYACFLLMLLSFTCAAFSQASRTWVSGVGDDVNPCSRTAPCKTFAGAISKTVAGGEIDVLDPGGFGGVTITKAITIDGNNIGSVLVAGTNGIAVSAGPSDIVIIRNLSINGLGQTATPGISGIRVNTVGSLIIEHVNIFNFGTAGIDFYPAAGHFHVRDTKISGAAVAGIRVSAGKGNIDNSQIQDSTTGIYAYGTLTVSNTAISGSTSRAFSAEPAAKLTLEHCVASDSGVGLFASGAVFLSNSTVTNNTTGLSISGGTITSFGNNNIAGNGTDGAPSTTISQK